MAPNPFAAIEIVPAIAVGTGVGGAVSGAIAPVVQQLQNDAWSHYPVRPVAAGLLASAVAQGQVDPTAAAAWALQQGYDKPQFDAMVAAADTGPGLGQAFRLWRRDLITDAGFRRAAKRLGIEEEWLDALEKTRQEPLDPAVLAAGIVRGLIPDPGILVKGPPTTEGKVKAFPVFDVDALADAKWAGYDRDRLSVMVGNYGRPMSPEGAAFAVFKGILDRVDFDRAVAEGDVRNEWADAIFENQRYVLSPADAAGLRLRGWKTKDEADAIGALHGATSETMQDLFLNRGRPATVHQTHIGYMRGGHLPGFENDEKGAAQRAVQESDIRPEWFDVLWAGRFTLPSAFVTRALTQDGTFTQPQSESILLESGWRPDLATAASEKWSGSGAGPSSKWLDRAKSTMFTAAHSDYLSGDGDEADVRPLLTAVGAVGAEQDAIINLWNLERSRVRRGLTQAQILKLYKNAVWQRDQALAALVELGMEPDDAGYLLDAQ